MKLHLNYKNQLILSAFIMILFNVMNTVFKNWIFTSIGWCLIGLLWVVHPVMIKDAVPSKKDLRIVRLAGGFMILMGLITRAHF